MYQDRVDSYCNVCKSVESKLLYAEEYSYAICKRCGHVYQTSRRDATHYHTLPYESQWNSYLEHSRNRADYVIDFCKDYIKEGSKIVDVGCGPGGTMKYLKERLPLANISGITSLSDKSIMVDKFEVEYGDFEEEINITTTDKDLALMCHVLEHFIDPRKALIKTRRMLKQQGLVYIEVPSFYWAEIRSNPQFCPVHLSYFTKSKLKYLLEKSGFTILKMHESKYWGNIKVLAKKERRVRKESLVEFWVYKLLKWKFNRLFGYSLYRGIKKLKKVSAND